MSQLKAGSEALVRYAKQKGTAMLLVGHVTKDGQIAGPKVIEHMVDTVLYFEGDRGHQYRILRAVKNRFGPTDEIGVFEMSDGGLKEVTNPSKLFMGTSDRPTPGTAIFAGMEGKACCSWKCRPLSRHRRLARQGAPPWARDRTASP